MKKIGIFGGAFNPIHKGHIAIAKEAINVLNLDKLYLVPGYKGPFKKDNKFESGKDRIEMINLVKENKMEISDFEIKRKGISYTIDTIKYFSNKFKDAELFLIIGSDNLAKLPKWKDIDLIQKYAKICVFRRDKKINKTNIKKFNALLLNNSIYNESSTEFLKGNFMVVDDKVRWYIGNNYLYFDEILRQTLSGTRFQHSINARKFGIELAKNLNVDIKKAGFAAFVHDIGKEYSLDESLRLIKKYEPSKMDIPKYMIHQEVGYIILKHIFKIEDDEILNSIRVHTSLSENLSLMDKIVFMADKLCLGRKWEGIQKVRELALSDFDEAFKFVVSRTEKFNELKGVEITEWQREIYNIWKK